MDKKMMLRIRRLAEEFFQTADDPEQMPVSEESWKKIQKISRKCFTYAQTRKKELQGFALVIPTQKELMDMFLKKKISEKDLLNMTKPAKEYDALYLCTVFVLPEHRRKGMATKLLKKLIGSAPIRKGAALFAWPYSKEGKLLASKLSKEYGRPIRLRE